MKLIGKILLILLSVGIGAFFVFSAYTKTEPVQYFEYTINSQLHLPWHMSALLARFFIGLELALGLLMVVNVFGARRWVLKLSLGMLILFSLHLVLLWITQGNDVNCGCMGSIAPMSPAASLLKNIGLMAGIGLLIRFYRTRDSNLLNIITLPVSLVLIAIPFVIYPLKQQLNLPLSRLYQPDQKEQPKTELRQGRHILCFMSLGCSHCRDAAKIITEMKRKSPFLPFYIIFPSGTDSTRAARLADFMADTKADNIPFHFVSQKDFVDMVQLSGNDGVPCIFWMKDTTIIRKISIPELNLAETEEWLKQ
ncbi:MauE/DoxX family redox-associated membrane protein [Taibaiella chishuiensis]|uniref:MauE/DoxX family redox-associated membrane protein n=1 Tax=Taibaiella chishuiensis TaxID=1434707 RepID=UPI000D0D7A1C|nr:MauE/DoxX family redox-associated membrane protein [Taibaiella chishuiensis]